MNVQLTAREAPAGTALRLIGPNEVYCEYCDQAYHTLKRGDGGKMKHPTFDECHGISARLDESLKTCPNAGKWFKFPILEEV